MITLAQIEAGRSPQGGWTKDTLARWGVPWPPPKGWCQALLDGTPILLPGVGGEPASAARPTDCPEAKLLHAVVMAVINAGCVEMLYQIDDLSVYYGTNFPRLIDDWGAR